MKILAAALLLPFTVSAQTLYKIQEDAFFCITKEPIIDIQKYIDSDVPREQMGEILRFAASTAQCGFTKPGIIASIQDFHKDFLYLQPLNIPNAPNIWVHKNQTSN